MTDARPASDAATFRPAGTLDISGALAPYGGPWSARLAAHLARRAGFGGSPADVARLASLSMDRAVDSFIHPPSTAGLPASPADVPDVRDQYAAYRQMLRSGTAKNDEGAVALRKQIGMLERQGYFSIGTWWLGRMVNSPAPLQEKMALFWHGHFASATGTKGITPMQGLAQNQLFREYALGNIHELTLNVSRDPAMLRYLDNAASRVEHPNENYARELMELFTLGIGNYTEQDVRESARAFTGWSIARDGSAFAFYPRFHDDGEKQFLGKRGNFDGKDIVDIIFQQPAAARFFARKLIAFFVYSDPEPELVDSVAALLEKYQFNVAPVLSTVFRSNVFYSDRAYRALVKSPAEFVAGTYQLFGLQPDRQALVAMGRMGQVLLRPPSVKGWDGGSAWLNSQAMLTRQNFVSGLVNGGMMDNVAWMTAAGIQPDATAKHFVTTILQGDASPGSVSKLVAYLNGSSDSALGMLSGENYQERLRGAAYLTMAMPAYQLS
jgi:uncharacterized protein (DUF1800 family)